MKIDIEYVQKVKDFEPFILKIQLNTIEDGRKLRENLRNAIDMAILHGSIDDNMIEIEYIKESLENELKKQGYHDQSS